MTAVGTIRILEYNHPGWPRSNFQLVKKAEEEPGALSKIFLSKVSPPISAESLIFLSHVVR